MTIRSIQDELGTSNFYFPRVFLYLELYLIMEIVKRNFLFFLFLAALGHRTHAQFYYPIQQDAVDFQKRTLLVQLLEEDEKTLKAFKSKYGKNKIQLEERLKLYTQQIQGQNEMIKAVFSKFWKANKALEFRTSKEIEEMLLDAKALRQYAILNIGWRTEYQFKNGSDNASPVEIYAIVAYVAEAKDRKLNDLKRSVSQKTDYILKIGFPTDHLETSDYILAAQQFNFHINNATAEGQVLERYRTLTYIPPFNKAGYEVIKKKILLLPTSVSEPDKREELKISYEYPFEIAEVKLFEEALQQQFGKYVYTTLLWSDRQNNFSYFIVNASEGIILAELGHVRPDTKFPNMLSETEKLEISDQSYYKNQTGFSINNLIQLQHILGPKGSGQEK